jgi:hypothetical protein
MVIGAEGITSPFPSAADYALKECDSEAARAVIKNLDLAIRRLKEYREQFENAVAESSVAPESVEAF